MFTAARQDAEQGRRLVAFLTDIGNDLLYNVDAQDITGALDSIIGRLEQNRAQIFATPVHPALEHALTPNNFILIRSFLYPGSRVTLKEVIEGLRTINSFLEDQQRQGRLFLIEGMDAHLGWDHVHYAWAGGARAWTLAAFAMLEKIGADRRHTVSVPRLFAAYGDNLMRLTFCDLLKLRRRSAEFF